MSIEKAYNSWAEQYDTNKNKTRDLDIRATVNTLNEYDFSRVLELGCGTGKNTKWLLNKAKRILGLDFSQEMLSVAMEKISDERVTFKKADLNEVWKVEKQSFDLITSSLTLEHIQELNHIFGQANSALVDGGLFFISELHPYKQYHGSGAKFELKNETIELKVFTHHITDFTFAAQKNGFQLLEIKEWFDEITKNEPPRLVSFVFRKLKI